ncbi:MAG: aminotransferase class I/II-fold pyridoxal phosphate-dependent enzyme [Anaerolineaceae bacterium]|nr:aminotransferase class I/II-fold pyridoxal phosphate-dependent enzyme [Anaerolineaceae bacterium]
MLYGTENPHGGDVYTNPVKLDFSASINPIGTPASVIDTLCRELKKPDRYPDPYCREAVRAVGIYENVDQDQVIAGNGAAELIYTWCGAVRPRKAMIVIPAFSEYERALKDRDSEIVYHLLSEDNDFLPDGSVLTAVSAHRPDALFLCDPNNPTGRALPEDLLNEILVLCDRLDVRVFLDECFRDLTGRSQNVRKLLMDHPGLFILKALTKTFALAGLRIGYGLTADSGLLRRMSCAVQPWNVSSLAQKAAAAALQERMYLDISVGLIRSERKYLAEELEALGFHVCPSEANFLLFQAPAQLGSLLLKEGIAVRDCQNFAGLGPGWFRTAVRGHRENETLIAAMRRIRQEQLI